MRAKRKVQVFLNDTGLWQACHLLKFQRILSNPKEIRKPIRTISVLGNSWNPCLCFCLDLSCFCPQHLILGSEYFRPGVLVCSDMWRVPILGCSWVWFLILLLPTEDVAATPTQMRGHLAQAQWSGLIPMEGVISIYPHEMTGCHPHFPPEMTGILSGSCASFVIQERYPGALSANFSLLPTTCTQVQAGFWHLLRRWRPALLIF